MKKEPVLTLAVVASVIVAIAAHFKIVLETGTVETVVTSVVLLVTAIVQRSKVSPTAT